MVPAHQKVEILERDDQGRPSKSRQVVKTVGVSGEQVLAYTILDDGVSWTLVSAKATTRKGRPLHTSRFLQPSKTGLHAR